jgi:hypothetical protein
MPTTSTGKIFVEPTPPIGDTTEAYLRAVYATDNDVYFDNKLPRDVEISNDLGGLTMADSECDDYGQECVVRFNPHFTAAPRVAESTMLHEMCHIKVWTRLLEKNRPEMTSQVVYDHGKPWQTCMLGLDSVGAFRNVEIDFYTGK